MVDTLRPDALGAEEAVPERLRGRGRHFLRAIAAGNWTSPSITALMTGRYASESGLIVDEPEARRPAGWTLGERLRAQGYATAAVVSNPFLFGAGLALEPGFETVDSKTTGYEPNRKVGRRNATETTDAALAMLKTVRSEAGGHRPYFLWVHYLEPHGPYVAPERFLRRPASGGAPIARSPIDSPGKGLLPSYQFLPDCRGRDDYKARYRASAAYALTEVDRFLAGAEATGALANTVIVFTSDHGEFLGEDDYWFLHGRRIDPAVVHVPLVIASSLAEPGSVDERLVSHLDVLPTLLRRLGIAVPPELEGEDLLSASAPRRHPIFTENFLLPATMEMGVVVGDRLIVRSNLEPTAGFAPAGTGGFAPAAVDEATAAAATELLRPRLSKIRTVEAKKHTFLPEEIRQLRSLGYLGPK